MEGSSSVLVTLLVALNSLGLFFILLILYNVNPRIKKILYSVIKRDNEGGIDKQFKEKLTTVANKYAPNALVLFNTHGEVLTWNKGAENMMQWSEAEMKGQDLLKIIPQQYHTEHTEWLRIYRETEITKTGSILYVTALKKNGQEFPVKLSFFLDKSIPGFDLFAVIVEDLSYLEKTKGDITQKIKEYEEYELIGGYGGWYWEVSDTDIVRKTKGFCRIFDIEFDEIYTSKDMLTMVHKDDLGDVNDIIEKAFNDLSDYTISYRITKRNKEEVKILCKAKRVMIYNENGEGILLAYKGTIQEI